MSYIIVLCTIITVFFLLQLSREQETMDNEGVQQVIKINEEQTKNTKEDKKIVEDNKKMEKTSKSSSDVKNEEQQKSTVKEDNAELKKEIKENDSNNKDVSISDVSNEEKEEPVITVFKVDKNTIMDKLSVSEKMKLINLSKKLSVIDYGRIKEYLESGEEYDSAVAIFRILKSRLTNDDYKEIKEILTPYIDLEKIEKIL